MATIVTRAGKGSELTHNEVDANFTNLNNDKVETLANLGVTSSAAELNILDGVTAVADELNKTDDSAAAVSGFVSGMRTYINVDGSSSTTFDFVTNVTESSFESVGPTGASATNTWTAMDVIPAAARIAILAIDLTLSPASTDSSPTFQVYARQTGSSAAADGATKVSGNAFLVDDFTAGTWQDYRIALVPLDSSRRFDITWTATGDTARTGVVRLKGFIL